MQETITRRRVLSGFGVSALVSSTWCGRSHAASGRRIPFGFRPAAPLVDVASDGTITGLEYEIVHAAMQVPGHEIIPYFGPHARLIQALYRSAVDAIAPAISLEGTQFTLSEPYLVYHNVAVSLAERQLRITSLRDLAGLRVFAFQRARKALGTSFAAAVADFGTYREDDYQEHQALTLLHDRADVIIGDRRILLHHLRAAMSGIGIWKDWKVHPIFTPAPCSVAFREPSIAADFNSGLARIHQDGTYQSIMARYIIPS